MNGTKVFHTAAKKAAADDVIEPITFTLDDVDITAYPPTPGQLAIMFTRISEYASDTERAAGTIDFFLGLLDDNSKQILGNRLLDRNDAFDLEEVNDIFTWLMDEFTARPTKSPSGSSASGRSTGKKSTVIALPEE